MNQIFSKFNLYDQVGYLLVGSIASVVAYADFVLLDAKFPEFNALTLPIWLIVAYFLGHVIQAIANLVIKEKKGEFSDSEKAILETAKTYFGLEKASDGEVWNLCYMLASAKDVTGHVQTFNAFYSLYRGWLVVFAIETIFIAGYAVHSYAATKLILLLLSLALAVLFHRRLKRFNGYFRGKVLQTYILVKTMEKESGK
jgi:hypothetical protein